MKRLLAIGVLGLYLCTFFVGCHTTDMLSRVKTGHVDLKDAWEAVVADDEEFQEVVW